ncbi:MAG: hypothetical protein LC808_00780 [Actinobacteria bacterium]|nr:hypothetical protein [Actinomycetota bacterium]
MSKTVTGITGALPPLGIRGYRDGVIEFNQRVPRWCEFKIKKAAVKVRIYGPHRATVTRSDACDSNFRRPRSVSTPAFRLRGDPFGASFTPTTKRNATENYRYKVFFGGRVLRERRFSVTTRVVPGHRVYRGTAEFYNYCVYNRKPISDGRSGPYCWRPTYYERTLTWLS